MKKILILAGLSLTPLLSFAVTAQQKAAQEAASFVDTFNTVILFPLIALLSAVAFLVFIWGCAQYLINANNDQGRQQGVQHITWGLIGLFIMVAAWAILSLFAATFGLDKQLECADDPNLPGCDTAFVL